ncbi:hypothetical protein TNCV_4127731 [Trichonephila clavipes]|uniref:Uncharacterized protein n=1 Tax=Trichonephila clavipes TaxID=2585209 RepID=A0A8X6T3K5_TRICX|nr:hypothetical protein TNCV_4127731 [Trichonephila clavipes]
MDLVILNLGQVTKTAPELAPPCSNYHTTPREDIEPRPPLRGGSSLALGSNSDTPVNGHFVLMLNVRSPPLPGTDEERGGGKREWYQAKTELYTC